MNSSSMLRILVALQMIFLSGYVCGCLFLQAPMPWPMLAMPLVDAFLQPSAKKYYDVRQGRWVKHRTTSIISNAVASDLEVDSSTNEERASSSSLYTSAILKVAYDGTYFRGFTAANSESKQRIKRSNDGTNNKHDTKPKSRQSRRSRTLQRKGGSYGRNGSIRTVEDTLRAALAKLYGNVSPSQIKVETCSRTDAGVHATSLVAQFYCTMTPNDGTNDNSTQQISKRPTSHDDTSNFLPLPFDSDLTKLVFVLNRMLPPDVRVVAASPMPGVSSSTQYKGAVSANDNDIVAFHPTLHTLSKTYTYQFAIGPVHDPLQTQYVWHLDGSSSRAVGMNGKKFCLERASQATNLFVDSSNGNIMNVENAIPMDYAAFRSAFRGTDRGRIQSTICKLWRCEILQERKELLPSWEIDAGSESHTTIDASVQRHQRQGSRLAKASLCLERESSQSIESPQTFTVVITGDRFLYKMVRNIVGTIVAVACGHLELDEVSTALETGKWGGDKGIEEDRSTTIEVKDEGETDESKVNNHTVRRICAPARGLTLAEVQYPTDIHFHWKTG